MAWSDEQVERAMGALLRAGVVVSATVVLAGAAWYFSVHGNAPLDFRVFQGEPKELRGPAGVVRGVIAGNERSVIQFGLLLLIATPIARVVFALAAFAMQKDKVYVGISLLVLAALLYGLAS